MTLDQAWREAEAALPEGWIMAGVELCGPTPMQRHEFRATAWGPWLPNDRNCDTRDGYGDTPIAALRELVYQLYVSRRLEGTHD